jgi:hypothetical protein
MQHALDELYFDWLCDIIIDPDKKGQSAAYSRLLNQLYRTEFVWFVAGDDSRAGDGTYMRYEFLEDNALDEDNPDVMTWMELGCSFLEMLVALTRRVYFLEGSPPHVWFWHFVTMMGLDRYKNSVRLGRTEDFKTLVQDKINTVIFRTYEYNGYGGLFPLEFPNEDQRKVEIWYQMNAYLIENF